MNRENELLTVIAELRTAMLAVIPAIRAGMTFSAAELAMLDASSSEPTILRAAIARLEEKAGYRPSEDDAWPQ